MSTIHSSSPSTKQPKHIDIRASERAHGANKESTAQLQYAASLQASDRFQRDPRLRQSVSFRDILTDNSLSTTPRADIQPPGLDLSNSRDPQLFSSQRVETNHPQPEYAQPEYPVTVSEQPNTSPVFFDDSPDMSLSQIVSNASGEGSVTAPSHLGKPNLTVNRSSERPSRSVSAADEVGSTSGQANKSAKHDDTNRPVRREHNKNNDSVKTGHASQSSVARGATLRDLMDRIVDRVRVVQNSSGAKGLKSAASKTVQLELLGRSKRPMRIVMKKDNGRISLQIGISGSDDFASFSSLQPQLMDRLSHLGQVDLKLVRQDLVDSDANSTRQLDSSPSSGKNAANGESQNSSSHGTDRTDDGTTHGSSDRTAIKHTSNLNEARDLRSVY